MEGSMHTIEPASSGRAKCRGCGQGIDKGVLRFGEQVENPFGDGDTTYWFHPRCAAERRPEAFLELETYPEQLANREQLIARAEFVRDHHRLARIEKVETAPSGRARCRHCKEKIDKGFLRIALTIWEEGRFNSMGTIHLACAEAYFGTRKVASRLFEVAPEELRNALELGIAELGLDP